jgi:hypothetical protein
MSKFKVIETKKKIQEVDKKSKIAKVGQATATTLNSLASLGGALGLKTQAINTIVGMGQDVVNIYNTWKNAFQKVEKTNDEKMLEYLGKDVNGQKIISQYMSGWGTTPVFGLMQQYQDKRGRTVNPLIYLYDSKGNPVGPQNFTTLVQQAGQAQKKTTTETLAKSKPQNVGSIKTLVAPLTKQFGFDQTAILSTINDVIKNTLSTLGQQNLMQYAPKEEIQKLPRDTEGNITPEGWQQYQTLSQNFYKKVMPLIYKNFTKAAEDKVVKRNPNVGNDVIEKAKKDSALMDFIKKNSAAIKSGNITDNAIRTAFPKIDVKSAKEFLSYLANHPQMA